MTGLLPHLGWWAAVAEAAKVAAMKIESLEKIIAGIGLRVFLVV